VNWAAKPAINGPFLFFGHRKGRYWNRSRKRVGVQPVTVASLPQGGAQMAVNRNSDQLFRFAFRGLQR
jgi:hypothetical protein